MQGRITVQTGERLNLGIPNVSETEVDQINQWPGMHKWSEAVRAHIKGGCNVTKC